MKKLIKSSVFKLMSLLPESVANEINVRWLKSLPRYRTEIAIKKEVEELYKKNTGNELDFENINTFNEKNPMA